MDNFDLSMVASGHVRRSAKASSIASPSPTSYDIRDMRFIKSGIARLGVGGVESTWRKHHELMASSHQSAPTESCLL